MFKHIVVAVDGSSFALRAVAIAGELAELSGAELILLNVIEGRADARMPRPLRAYAAVEHVSVTQADVLQEMAEEVLAAGSAEIAARGVHVKTLVAAGDPATAIIRHAMNVNAELIVLGNRGLSDLKGLLLGSVSHKVTQGTAITIGDVASRTLTVSP